MLTRLCHSDEKVEFGREGKRFFLRDIFIGLGGLEMEIYVVCLIIWGFLLPLMIPYSLFIINILSLFSWAPRK